MNTRFIPVAFAALTFVLASCGTPDDTPDSLAFTEEAVSIETSSTVAFAAEEPTTAEAHAEVQTAPSTVEVEADVVEPVEAPTTTVAVDDVSVEVSSTVAIAEDITDDVVADDAVEVITVEVGTGIIETPEGGVQEAAPVTTTAPAALTLTATEVRFVDAFGGPFSSISNDEAGLANDFIAHLNATGRSFDPASVQLQLNSQQAGDVTELWTWTGTALDAGASTGITFNYEMLISGGGVLPDGTVLDAGALNDCANWDSCPNGFTASDITFQSVTTYTVVSSSNFG